MNDFEDAVGVACQSAAIRQGARQQGLSQSTVQAIDKRFLARWQARRRVPALRQMGIDEIYLGKSEAEAVIRSIADQKGFGHFHHTAYYIACAYARMGNMDAALEWLREAAGSGFPCYPLFLRDPNLEALRRDPRWSSWMGEVRRNWEGYQKLVSEKI